MSRTDHTTRTTRPTGGGGGGRYKFLVWNGNNSGLIRAALLRRPWWENALEDDSAAFEPPPEPDTPAALRRRVTLSRVRAVMEEAFLGQDFDFCWRPTLGVRLHNPPSVATLHSVEPPEGRPFPQLVNHFSSISCLTSKNGLLRSLEAFYGSIGLETFDFTPTTFVVKGCRPREASDGTAWGAFLRRYREIGTGDFSQERMPPKQCANNMWILKPASLNQGRGIQVFSELSKIKMHLYDVPSNEEWIVQKYLERPLLLSGRKFDIRMWALVTHSFDIYVYVDGYIRTSSEAFTLDLGGTRGGEGARMVHLTNYCMQKHSKNVGRFEDGNTLSFDQLQAYLDEQYPDLGVTVKDSILPRIKELILDSLLSVRMSLDSKNKGRRSFELFGYDFMIDEDFRVWLIEVNTNPYLGVQNAWHGNLLVRMVEDMVQVAVDPLFPGPPGAHPSPPPCYLPEAEPRAAADVAPTSKPMAEWKNGWELLFTEESEGAIADTPHHRFIESDAQRMVDLLEQTRTRLAAVLEASSSPTDLPKATGGSSGGARLPLAGTEDSLIASVGEAAPKSFSLRWLRRRSVRWLYPIGPPTPMVSVPRAVLPNPVLDLKRGPIPGPGHRRAGSANAALENSSLLPRKLLEPLSLTREVKKSPHDLVNSLPSDLRAAWCAEALRYLLLLSGETPMTNALDCGALRPPLRWPYGVRLKGKGARRVGSDGNPAPTAPHSGGASPTSLALASTASPGVIRAGADPASPDPSNLAGAIRRPAPGLDSAREARVAPSCAEGALSSFARTELALEARLPLRVSDYSVCWPTDAASSSGLDLSCSHDGLTAVSSPSAPEHCAEFWSLNALSPDVRLPALSLTDVKPRRRWFGIAARALASASKETRLMPLLTRSGVFAAAMQCLDLARPSGRLSALFSETAVQNLLASLNALAAALKMREQGRHQVVFSPIPTLVRFALIPGCAAACDLAASCPLFPNQVPGPIPPLDLAPSAVGLPALGLGNARSSTPPTLVEAPGGAPHSPILKPSNSASTSKPDGLPDAEAELASRRQAAAEKARGEASALEQALCFVAFRQLCLFAETIKPDSSARRLFLLSGVVQAALFATEAFASSTNTRQVALEVLRFIRKSELEALRTHLREHPVVNEPSSGIPSVSARAPPSPGVVPKSAAVSPTHASSAFGGTLNTVLAPPVPVPVARESSLAPARLPILSATSRASSVSGSNALFELLDAATSAGLAADPSCVYCHPVEGLFLPPDFSLPGFVETVLCSIDSELALRAKRVPRQAKFETAAARQKGESEARAKRAAEWLASQQQAWAKDRKRTLKRRERRRQEELARRELEEKERQEARERHKEEIARKWVEQKRRARQDELARRKVTEEFEDKKRAERAHRRELGRKRVEEWLIHKRAEKASSGCGSDSDQVPPVSDSQPTSIRPLTEPVSPSDTHVAAQRSTASYVPPRDLHNLPGPSRIAHPCGSLSSDEDESDDGTSLPDSDAEGEPLVAAIVPARPPRKSGARLNSASRRSQQSPDQPPQTSALLPLMSDGASSGVSTRHSNPRAHGPSANPSALLLATPRLNPPDFESPPSPSRVSARTRGNDTLLLSQSASATDLIESVLMPSPVAASSNPSSGHWRPPSATTRHKSHSHSHSHSHKSHSHSHSHSNTLPHPQAHAASRPHTRHRQTRSPGSGSSPVTTMSGDPELRPRNAGTPRRPSTAVTRRIPSASSHLHSLALTEGNTSDAPRSRLSHQADTTPRRARARTSDDAEGLQVGMPLLSDRDQLHTLGASARHVGSVGIGGSRGPGCQALASQLSPLSSGPRRVSRPSVQLAALQSPSQTRGRRLEQSPRTADASVTLHVVDRSSPGADMSPVSSDIMVIPALTPMFAATNV